MVPPIVDPPLASWANSVRVLLLGSFNSNSYCEKDKYQQFSGKTKKCLLSIIACIISTDEWQLTSEVSMTTSVLLSPSVKKRNQPCRSILDGIRPFMVITSAFGLAPFIYKSAGSGNAGATVTSNIWLLVYSMALNGTALGFGIWAMFQHYITPMVYIYQLTRCIDVMVDLTTFASLGVFGLPAFLSFAIAWPKLKTFLDMMARVDISWASYKKLCGAKGFLLTPELACGLCLVVLQLAAEPVWYSQRMLVEPNVLFVVWVIIWSFVMSLIADLLLVALNASLTAAFRILVNDQLACLVNSNTNNDDAGHDDDDGRVFWVNKTKTPAFAWQLEKIRLRHASLCKLSQQLADAFSYWILTTSLTVVVLSVLVCTLIIRYFTLTMSNRFWETDVVNFLPGFFMILARMYLLCISAAKVEEESRKADAMLTDLNLLEIDSDSRDQVMYFSMQLAKNNARQSAAGYFDVSTKALFLSVLGQFTTYIIVAYEFLQELPPTDGKIFTFLANATGRINDSTLSAADIDVILRAFSPQNQSLQTRF